MKEHIQKIRNNRQLYYIHIALYIAFMVLNVETILDPKIRSMGYPLAAAIVFTALFVFMVIVEVISFQCEEPFLAKWPVGLIFHIFQILVIAVYSFMLPEQMGAGPCMAALILVCVELIFEFQFDELPRRVFMYILFGVPYEAVTVVQMVHSGTLFRAIRLFVSTNVVIISVVLICELIACTYNYFIRLLLAQNRTLDNLNEVNEKLKEQQEEIKKTNELLGMQKIELQAANKKINRSHDEMSVQNEIAGAITSTVKTDDLLEKVCRIMRVRLDMDLAGIMLEPDPAVNLPGGKKEVRRVSLSTTLGEVYSDHVRELILAGELDDIFELSHTFIQNTETSHTRLNQEVSEEKVLESLVVVPLVKQEERIGSMIIGKRNINAFMDNRAFYENIASQISIGISNMRLYDQMREMAIRDGLTRIYNRRHLTKLLTGYLSEAMQKKTDVSLALFDIDKFKMVNDTYGHQCGDAVICHVAALLNEATVSHGGIAGRYGGEEFVIAFLGKSLAEVTGIVEEVHAKIKAEKIVYEDKELQVSASAGVASYPETCKNPAELLTRADWAMYHSKRNGRDRITIDSEELETEM